MAAQRKLCPTKAQQISNYDVNIDGTECVVVKRNSMHPQPFKMKSGQFWIQRSYFEQNIHTPSPVNIDSEYNSMRQCGFVREQFVERDRNTGKITWLNLRCAAALAANMRFEAAHDAFMWLKEIILCGKITYEDQVA